jgi:hypothetical protein
MENDGWPQLPGGTTNWLPVSEGLAAVRRDRDVRSMQALISVPECSSAVVLPSSLPHWACMLPG